MCGIAGYFNLPLNDQDGLALLQAMCDRITYRGPDDAGYFCNKQTGLGMRRLSIIDLARGHQPISSPDGLKTIILNGEIYNYQTLRKDLLQSGYSFSTESDTEVILAQYEKDGTACVHSFNGMFAFAIWDEARDRLFLARDRMGVKPLYYYWDGQQFLFASEIKSILAYAGVKSELNMQAIWDYLTFRYVPGPQTVWKNIYKLPPAHTLTLCVGQPEPLIKRYWDIPYTDAVSFRSEEELLSEFTDLFLDAVRLRLIADVPVGILLSGGLDSSCVAAAVAEKHNARLSSFSVSFNGATHIDETPYARLVAQHIGTDHHEIMIGAKEFVDFLPDFVNYSDEPLADLASVPLYYVSQLSRQRVKVVLSGEGSDEVLGGYDLNFWLNLFDKRRSFQQLPGIFQRGIGLSALRRVMGNRFNAKYDADLSPLDQRLLSRPFSATNYLTGAEKNKLFGKTQPWRDSYAVLQEDLRRLKTSDPLHQILFTFSQNWLVEDLLMKADRMSMANSIELRTPFLDYRLVEWAARSPSQIKVGREANGEYITKRVLRQFARSRLPIEIIEREKMGFPVPLYDWLSSELKPWAFEVLGGSGTQLEQWFERNEINCMLQAGTQAGAPVMARHNLWALLILEFWSRTWLRA